jgi:hypothetical protein
MCTGISPRVRGVMRAATLAGSRLKLSGSMSANTGVAPTMEIASAEAKKVNGVVITSSPGPMSSARNASTSASVPLATPVAWSAPR